MPQPVFFHPAAVEEAEAAVSWYSTQSPRAGRAFVAELERAVEALAEAPERWPRGSFGTRRLLLQRFPFAVVYRLSSESVTVIAVAHGRRRPDYWRER